MNALAQQGIPFLFIIDYEMKEPIIVPIDDAASYGIYFNISKKTNHSFIKEKPQKITFSKTPVTFKKYKKAFELVQQHMKAGDSYLVNLTFPTAISTNVSLLDFFLYSDAPYRLLMEDRCVVFSPESFIRIKDGKIFSSPMKGTIPAAISDAEAVILGDEKEKAEHTTVVDLIRNDLSLAATAIRVDDFRFINRVTAQGNDLLQVSSRISGVLPKDYKNRIGDIIVSQLPAGSICGAPKKRTLEIIKEAENYKRGYYTGVFGFFDGKDLESAVMIRFIEKDGEDMYYKSGGGITVYSDADKEYQEMVDKVYVPFN